jgi:hypothetical protein
MTKSQKRVRTAAPQLDKHTAAATPIYPNNAAYDGHCATTSNAADDAPIAA